MVATEVLHEKVGLLVEFKIEVLLHLFLLSTVNTSRSPAM